VVRISDQAVVGHYRSRREAAEKAFQFSKIEPHVAMRQVGPGWPHLDEGAFDAEAAQPHSSPLPEPQRTAEVLW
jgi:hypothetical protein